MNIYRFGGNFMTISKNSWSSMIILQRRFAISKCLFSSSNPNNDQNNIDWLFKKRFDRYGGIHYDTIETDSESIRTIGLEKLSNLLQKNLNEIDKNINRTVWFSINNENVQIIEPLVKLGFKFHHTKPDKVIMYLSLTSRSNIPRYSYTNIGVGGLVTNDQNEMLLVKEKVKMSNFWKFPGGYVEQGEELNDAVVREVFEETGIKTQFCSILAIRHLHRLAFDCSDLYIVCHLNQIIESSSLEQQNTIQICPHEIDQCEWMPIDENIHQNLSKFNNFVVKKFLEYRKNQFEIGFDRIESTFPPPNNHFNVYSIRKKRPR